MHLWRTKEGVIVSDGMHAVTVENEWDALINRPDLMEYLRSRIAQHEGLDRATAVR